MSDELTYLEELLTVLETHAERKKELYDGGNRDFPLDKVLRFATEELGEVAAAVTRKRTALAIDECIDLAHCAYLIYQTLKQQEKKNA